MVLPELISDDSWHGTAQMILDTMVAQGSVVGRVRRAEFIALEEILGPLAKLAANDVAANGVTYAQQHQHQHMQHPTTQQQHQHYQHHHHHPSDSVESMGNGGTSEVGANGYHHSPNGGHSIPRGHHQHHVSSSHNGGGSSMSPHDAALGAVHSPGADDHIQAGGLDAWDPALDAASMNPDPSFLFDLALQFRPDSEMDIIGHL